MGYLNSQCNSYRRSTRWLCTNDTKKHEIFYQRINNNLFQALTVFIDFTGFFLFVKVSYTLTYATAESCFKKSFEWMNFGNHLFEWWELVRNDGKTQVLRRMVLVILTLVETIHARHPYPPFECPHMIYIFELWRLCIRSETEKRENNLCFHYTSTCFRPSEGLLWIVLIPF